MADYGVQGSPETTFLRQQAIDNLLRLMGCTDARSSKCEHVAAVEALADACFRTIGDMVGLSMGAISHIKPGVTGHREGHL